MKIVVLCAGTSTEREVSIVTGKMVCKALRQKGHNARVLDVFFGTYGKNIDKHHFFEGDYHLETEIDRMNALTSGLETEKQSRSVFFGENVLDICQTADIVFMALHGANGEDGKVQAAFDLFGIKYTGTGYLGSALAMDKGMTKQLFLANHVPTPNGLKLTVNDTEDYLKTIKHAGIHYPCVVKPCCGGSSIGVSIPNNDDEFIKAVKEAFALEEHIIVEEYIKGREFSVGVIDGEALPIIEIIPLQGFYDYKNKYQEGATKDECPAHISEELTQKMQSEAVHASKVLQLDTYSRIDFISDSDGQIYCLEANTLPGMTPTSLLPQEAAALGIEFPELCEKLINVSLSIKNTI